MCIHVLYFRTGAEVGEEAVEAVILGRGIRGHGVLHGLADQVVTLVTGAIERVAQALDAAVEMGDAVAADQRFRRWPIGPRAVNAGRWPGG
jgi:hypothetical protein